jgi:PLU-1-like protein
MLPQFGPYLEWDNRRNTNHAKEISIDSLRRIVVEGNSIHAQIGNAPQKIARILAQAELWYEKHKDILIRLKDISVQDQIDVKVDTPIIISELTDAILDSEAMLSFDLEEVFSLRREVDRINRWLNRVATIAPIKRSKRVGKSRWSSKASRCTLDEIKLLLEEAKTLPILTDSEEQRLRSQLSEIHQWQNIAQQRIQIIANVIRSIGDRKAKQNEVHIPSSNDDAPCFEYIQVHDNPHLTKNLPNGLAHASLSQENQNNEEEFRFDISLLFKSDLDDCDKLLNADRCVSWLKQEAQKLGVMTVEEEILANLEKIVNWFMSSIQVLKSPIELYENSVAPKLTALLESGNELRKCCSNDFPLLGLQTCCGQVVQSSWSTIIEQQLKLLENLNIQRDAFLSWSKSVENLISMKEKKLTFDAIDEFVAQSRQYPSCKSNLFL